MTEFPRVRLERFPMAEKRRFRLQLRSDQFSVDNSGAINVWIDRGDVSNLSFDCGASLLDDDVENGGAAANQLVESK